MIQIQMLVYAEIDTLDRLTQEFNTGTISVPQTSFVKHGKIQAFIGGSTILKRGVGRWSSTSSHKTTFFSGYRETRCCTTMLGG